MMSLRGDKTPQRARGTSTSAAIDRRAGKATVPQYVVEFARVGNPKLA